MTPINPADARALIAEGKRHDEAMTPSPWRTHTPGCGPGDHICGWSQHHEAEGPFGGLSATGPDVWTKESALVDAAGIAWMRTNLARLLDGYTEALEAAAAGNDCRAPGMHPCECCIARRSKP